MIETNVIYNEDCIRGMIQHVPDESIDLIVSDPPYLMNYQSGMRKEKFARILNDKNAESLITDYMEQCYRVLKNNHSIFLFCSWHKIDFFKIEFSKYFTMKNLIVWVKNHHGAGDLTGGFAPKHELILYGHKGRATLRGPRTSDVIYHSKVNGSILQHPTEKPVGLIESLIGASSDRGDIILDGFMGGGSTALACLYSGRKYVGFELDPTYYSVCLKRTSSYQMTLF